MSPEEEALLRARLGGGAFDAASPALSQAEAFGQKLRGAAPMIGQGLLGAAEHVSGFGPVVAAGQALNGLEGANRAHEAIPKIAGHALAPTMLAPGNEGEGMRDMSAATRTAMRAEDAGPSGEPRHMYAPDVDVQAAPTLDPKYGQTMRQPGGVGGGGPNIGLSLRSTLEGDRRAQLHTMEQERDLTGYLGAAKAGRIMANASLQDVEAARQEKLIADQQRIDAEATSKHQAFIARNEQLADEIGKMKIDPNRMMRTADANTQVGFAIGGILGGALAGLNGGPNTSLARLDKMIDRDIHAQEAEVDNKKASLGARNTVFGQMMQETGDRRLAGQQTRVMMLEAAKLKIQADADRLNIPEVRTNAELATNAIQQKIDAAKTAMDQAAYQAFLQQAQAAASARTAAEKMAWDRSMAVAELGLKKDKLTIDRMEAEAKGGETLSKQIQSLGKDMADNDLAKNRGAVDNLKQQLAAKPENQGLDGVGKMADFRSRFKPTGLNVVNPVAQLVNAAGGLSDKERVTRGDWEKVKLAYQSQITGSGASEKEREMLSAAFEGDKSPAEQRNAIKLADDFFARREAAIHSSYDPRAVSIFEQRREGYKNPQQVKK